MAQGQNKLISIYNQKNGNSKNNVTEKTLAKLDIIDISF